jgi:hypothetical protein
MNGAYVTLRRQVGASTYWVTQNVYTARVAPSLDIYFDSTNCTGNRFVRVDEGAAPGFAFGNVRTSSTAYLVGSPERQLFAQSRQFAVDGTCDPNTNISGIYLPVMVDTTLGATPVPFTLEPQ